MNSDMTFQNQLTRYVGILVGLILHILPWGEVGRHMPLPQDKVHERLVLPFFPLEKGCRCPHNKLKSNHKCLNASNTFFPTQTVVLVRIHILWV